MENYHSQSLHMSRRFFIFTSALFLSGCAKTTKECMNIQDETGRMDCIYGQMFPAIATGVIIGSISGAVLGGAVAFSTGNALQGGLIIGGIVGGITGGVIAYVNFSLERANNNTIRAIEDVRQDIKSDLNKLNRMAEASLDSFYKMKSLMERGFKHIEDSIAKDQKIRESTIHNLKEAIDVYKNAAVILAHGNSTSINNQLYEMGKKLEDLKADVEETNLMLKLKNG